MKEKANTYKNDGNELMKQDKYKEALDCYNKAIEIDKNNAVFYCNRYFELASLSHGENGRTGYSNAAASLTLFCLCLFI